MRNRLRKKDPSTSPAEIAGKPKVPFPPNFGNLELLPRVVSKMKRRQILAMILAAYIIFLLDIALFRFPVDQSQTQLGAVPLDHQRLAERRVGFVVNFWAISSRSCRWGCCRRSFGSSGRRSGTRRFSACRSVSTIEAGQYVSGRRVPDVDDLILNTLGGILGFLAIVGRTGGSDQRSVRSDELGGTCPNLSTPFDASHSRAEPGWLP